MVHFMLGSLIGLVAGYFLCIGHAKLTLALYRYTPEGRREDADRRHAEWVRQHPPHGTVEPSSSSTKALPLSEQWNLPHRHSEDVCEPVELIRTEQCPDGYGAAQALGYNDWGRIKPSLYPGGKEAFLAEN